MFRLDEENRLVGTGRVGGNEHGARRGLDGRIVRKNKGGRKDMVIVAIENVATV